MGGFRLKQKKSGGGASGPGSRSERRSGVRRPGVAKVGDGALGRKVISSAQTGRRVSSQTT